MSKEDARFDYPVTLVNQHILGCFEASKACAILPGKPHLYHAEFIKRPDHHVKELIKQGAPVDFYTEVRYSPCEEVSWYLHTRENLPVYEGSTEVDDKFVEDNKEGDITEPAADFEPVTEMWNERVPKESSSYVMDMIEANAKRLAALAATVSVPTPEKSTDIMTDTFGCTACEIRSKDNHSRACKSRRSRFDKINKELDK